MRTASVWGRPPARFYRFIQHVRAEHGPRARFAVLGCSDGKFVLPIARLGHQVLALDIDATALFGGTKAGPAGAMPVVGLRQRLRTEDLDHLVDVVHSDFVTTTERHGFGGVWTSGSIQYSHNLRHDVAGIVGAIKRRVAKDGFLYADYMLPNEPQHMSRPNFLTREAMAAQFSMSDWRVLMHRTHAPAREAAHVDKPVDHYHRWGHIFAQRLRGTR